ncbi:hypothetical protein B0H12DRAFT_1262353 [Mycena haematopus]|nr:hypothetical protein B0H12DRAFT_1262353 [Mycena haematopus]
MSCATSEGGWNRGGDAERDGQRRECTSGGAADRKSQQGEKMKDERGRGNGEEESDLEDVPLRATLYWSNKMHWSGAKEPKSRLASEAEETRRRTKSTDGGRAGRRAERRIGVYTSKMRELDPAIAGEFRLRAKPAAWHGGTNSSAGNPRGVPHPEIGGDEEESTIEGFEVVYHVEIGEMTRMRAEQSAEEEQGGIGNAKRRRGEVHVKRCRSGGRQRAAGVLSVEKVYGAATCEHCRVGAGVGDEDRGYHTGMPVLCRAGTGRTIDERGGAQRLHERRRCR